MSSGSDFFVFSLPEGSLLTHLNDCRLRKRFTDITIKVGEEEYPAHKIVLEASSPVLRAWLTDHWKRKDDIYELSGDYVDSEIVEDLLTFFYTAKVKITSENAYAFCMVSHYLSITSLLEASERFLSQKVVPSNIFDLFLLADKLKLETLRNQCVDCVVSNYEIVLKDNRVLTYSLEDLKLLIKEINDKNEDLKIKEVLFECLMNWVENDLPGRSASLPSLLRTLPLTELPAQFLGEVVANQNVISESPICLRLLTDAFKEAFKTSRKPKTLKSCKLYCFGGKNENGEHLSTVSCLDVSTRIWNTVKSISTARSDFGGAIIGTKIYLCGGKTKGANLKTVEMYDCLTNTTTPLRSMPEPRGYCAAAAIHEHIYVSGGDPSTGARSMLRYNTLTNEWQQVKSMQETRQSHQFVALNNRLYAISGFETSCEVYNPSIDQWTMMASTQNKHPWGGAAVHDGKIYVCSHNGFEVYSPDTNTWQTLTSLNNFQGKTLVSMNGKLWALGGNSQSYKGSTSVYSYDITTGQWTLEPDMDVSRGHHCSFVVPN